MATKIQGSAPTNPTHGKAPGQDIAPPGDTTQSNISGSYAAAETNDNSLVSYAVAWGLLFLLLGLFNRSRAGHAIIYYGLVLALLVLLAVNYQAITALLAPASGLGPGDRLHPPEPPISAGPGGDPGAGPLPPVLRTTTSTVSGRAPSIPTAATGSGHSANGGYYG